WNLPRGLGLVFADGGRLRDQFRPQLGAGGVVELLHQCRERLGAHLDCDLGVGFEVVVPGGEAGRACFRTPHWLPYSSWRRNQTPVSLRPSGARSSHWYMPHRPSSPRAYSTARWPSMDRPYAQAVSNAGPPDLHG